MPPANVCHNCGRPSPSGNTFCASCGATLSARSGGKGWKLFFGVFALFAGLLWAAAIFTRPGPPAGASRPQALFDAGSNTAAAQVAQSAPQPPLTLTSAQHLAEAKRALADGYKPGNDPRKAKWGEVAAAKWHLRSIAPATLEYPEAQELLKEVARRERRVELARKQAEAETDKSAGEAAAADAADEDDDKTSSAVTSAAAPSSAPSSTSASAAARQSPPATGTGGNSSSGYYTNSRGRRVQRPTFSENGPPDGATAQCRDGSYSFSQSRRGTCSHHGGVSRWL